MSKLSKICIVLVFWCGLSSAEQLHEVRVGISPVMSSAALFIAMDKGYFKEQGIRVKLNPFKASGAKMVPFLATGQLHVGGGNISAGMYNAIAHDIPIRIVADKGTVSPGHGYLALIVRKDLIENGLYRSYKDLKGMRMAVTAKGVSQQIVTEMYLREGGLGLADIDLKYLAYQDMNIALANHSLDATVQIEPFVASAEKNKIAVRVSGNDAIYPNQQSAALMYSPIFIEKSPKIAEKFMVAYVKGLRDYNRAFEKNNDKKSVVEILTKYTRIKDPSIYQMAVPVGLHPDGQLNIQSLKKDAEWYFRKGYLKQKPDINQIVDNRFVTYANQVLGSDHK